MPELVDKVCESVSDGDCRNKTDCENGVNLALVNAEANEAKYYYFSYPTPDYTSYLWVLQNVYNVKTTYGGEIETTEKQCYNVVIGEQLQQKFGKNFWMDVAQRADSINNLGLSEEEIYGYVHCHLNYALENTTGKPAQVVVACKISATGELVESRVIQSFNAAHDAEALRVIRAIPKWKPISQSLQIPIIFDEKLRKGCPE